MPTKYSVSLDKIIKEMSLETVYMPPEETLRPVRSIETNRPGLEFAGFYEYYDNGVVSNVKAYWSSEIEEGENYPDIEWERDFYESGKLKMECKYDSSDMDYREEYYDENGEETESKYGTYTEDGTKTEEVTD